MEYFLEIITSSNFKIVLVIIFLLLITMLLKYIYPIWQGYFAEQEILRLLLKLDAKFYIVAYDIMLPSQGNSVYTQIDHIVISNYGIFCIEVKAYKGWIFGNAKQKTWTQVIYKHKERFYNPIRQNYVHIKALENLLGNELKDPIVPLVVFTHADKLKISNTDFVVNTKGLKKKILSYNKAIYSDEQRDRIYHLLSNNNIIDKGLKKDHVIEIKGLKNK